MQGENSAPINVMPSELRDLVARAQSGDATALPRLREWLDQNPEIWKQAGDLALHVRTAWIELLSGKDLFAREVIERRVADLRSELAGPKPSQLENLLVERILDCWLNAQYADAALAESQMRPAFVLRDLRRRQLAADGRFVGAVKQLAVVRKLLSPDKKAESPTNPTATIPTTSTNKNQTDV